MWLKILLHLFLLPRNGFAISELLDMYSVWDTSQVFVYYESKFNLKNPPRDFFQNPDCFGYKISPLHVLTTSSCFMNLKTISRMFENNEKQELIEKRILGGIDLKLNIENYLIVQVISIYIFNICCSEFDKKKILKCVQKKSRLG